MDFNKSRKIAYCDGPVTPGVPETKKFSTRWAAWVSDTGVRVGKYEEIDLPSNNQGEASHLYLGAKPPHLTISFTKAALLGIAIEKDASTVELKLYTSDTPPDGTFSTFTWQGRSPLLFNNWLLYWDVTEGDKYDLVCYYVSVSFPNQILARFQRENFAVEHIIHSDLPVDIDYLVSTDVYQYTKQVMLLKTTDDSNATLYSDDYGLVADDASELLVEFVSGNYIDRAAPLVIPNEDNISGTVEIVEILESVVASLSGLEQASTSISVSFTQGTYE